MLLDDLKTTLKESKGYGLAAPQVGVGLRVIAVEVNTINNKETSYKDMSDVPFTIMINPRTKVIQGAKVESEYEGCLSIPEIRGKVKRPTSIFVEYYTPDGIKVQRFVRGFLARLIQHECDHLNGILFIDKVEKESFATKRTIKEFNLK